MKDGPWLGVGGERIGVLVIVSSALMSPTLTRRGCGSTGAKKSNGNDEPAVSRSELADNAKEKIAPRGKKWQQVTLGRTGWTLWRDDPGEQIRHGINQSSGVGGGENASNDDAALFLQSSLN